MLGFQAARPLPAALLCHVALEICLLASASFVCSSKEGVESKEWYCITKCGELIHRGNVLYGRDSMGLYVVSSIYGAPYSRDSTVPVHTTFLVIHVVTVVLVRYFRVEMLNTSKNVANT